MCRSIRAQARDRMGSMDGASTGTACAAGIISVSARKSCSSSLSDFADLSGPVAISILRRSDVASTDEEADGVATLIAIEAIEVTRQKRANHIVLVILDPKAAASRSGMDLRDQIRAARWLANVHLEPAGSVACFYGRLLISGTHTNFVGARSIFFMSLCRTKSVSPSSQAMVTSAPAVPMTVPKSAVGPPQRTAVADLRSLDCSPVIAVIFHAVSA